MRTRSAVQAIAALALGAIAATSPANDSAAAVAAGGIVLRNEHRVAIRSERLFISKREVRVEYEFLNDSDEDVVTELAFPVPPYRFSETDDGQGVRAFGDFKAWAEDRELPVQTEVRAFVSKEDVTRLVTEAGIDIPSFGHPKLGTDGFRTQVDDLPAARREALAARGACRPGAKVRGVAPEGAQALSRISWMSFANLVADHIVRFT
jgi:hypothetical protein